MLAIGFDCETSGLIDNRTIKLDKQPEIIEFYGCVFETETGEVFQDFGVLIKPKHKVSEEITRITTITNEMLVGCHPFAFHANAIRDFLGAAPTVIGHNLSYDKEMIDIEFQRLGEVINWPATLCTVEQTIHLKGYRQSLSNLHKLLFNQEFSGAHRAKADVQAMVKCVVELTKRGEL